MTETEITFDAVHQRWSESTEALEKLHEHIAELNEAEGRQNSAADSLDAAAAALNRSAASIDGVAEGASGALTQLLAAVEVARQLLEGESIRDIRQAVIDQGTAMDEGISGLRELVSSKLEALENEREEARAQRDVLRQRVDALEAAISRIPEKQRQKLSRKFGLS